MNFSNIMTADEAVKLIKSGDHVYIQGSTSIPETLVEAMTRRGDELRGVVLHSGFSVSDREAPYCRPEYKDSFLVDTCFVSSNVRRWIAEGYGATTPRFLGEVPQLFRSGIWPVDVVLLNCSMPDAEGYVSYGVSADLAVSATECARVVIAQFNPHMPFSYGDPVIHMSKITAAVEVNDPLVEVPTPEPGAVETAIGNAVAELIPDGATLQIGVGAIPNAVIRALRHHKHLGLHTEAMTDGVLPLIESGVIDNSMKKVYPGKSVACLALGSRNLYQLMEYNNEKKLKEGG
ncbi:MAG: 4-hydroxybutyrate CoA-transferase, partial [Duncaniella sp.]|nr:4-hydroxybutyrate CoA-transferase [Duncaniella sp.]